MDRKIYHIDKNCQRNIGAIIQYTSWYHLTNYYTLKTGQIPYFKHQNKTIWYILFLSLGAFALGWNVVAKVLTVNDGDMLNLTCEYKEVKNTMLRDRAAITKVSIYIYI